MTLRMPPSLRTFAAMRRLPGDQGANRGRALRPAPPPLKVCDDGERCGSTDVDVLRDDVAVQRVAGCTASCLAFLNCSAEQA